MPKKPTINAVIEGGFQGNWNSAHYKISNLIIPKNITKIDDGEFTFILSGNTYDFKRVEEAKYDENKEIIIDIENLASCEGIYLNSRDFPPSNWLQRPRAIVARDGRIYIDHSLDINFHIGYCTDAVPHLVEFSGEVFGNKKWDDFYKKYSSIKKFSIPKKKASQGVFRIDEIPEMSEYFQMHKKLMGE